MTIHPTAIVDPRAELAADVEIGPYCVVSGVVRLGPGVRLHNHVTLQGPATVGAHNEFYPYASIGGDPQDLKYKPGEQSELIIGDNNRFRECVTVNRGTALGGGRTVIGNRCLVMAYSHIAHDCILEDNVILANLATLAGHIKVESFANISGLVGVHHFVTIGTAAFVSGMTRVNVDVPPYVLFDGNPGRPRALNREGIVNRRKMPWETYEAIKGAFRLVYRSGMNIGEALDKIEADGALHAVPEVKYFVEFHRRTAAGKFGRALEANRATHFNAGQTETKNGDDDAGVN